MYYLALTIETIGRVTDFHSQIHPTHQLRTLKMFSKLKDHLKEQVQHFVDSNNPLEPAHISPPASAYWKASMGPNVPLSQDWRQETGAHGWGNAELQDYTTDERNSSIRAVGSGAYALSIRAIIEPQRITSARLTSHQKLSRDKGYLTARITAPSASEFLTAQITQPNLNPSLSN